jgi:hypothetical protein
MFGLFTADNFFLKMYSGRYHLYAIMLRCGMTTDALGDAVGSVRRGEVVNTTQALWMDIDLAPHPSLRVRNRLYFFLNIFPWMFDTDHRSGSDPPVRSRRVRMPRFKAGIRCPIMISQVRVL